MTIAKKTNMYFLVVHSDNCQKKHWPQTSHFITIYKNAGVDSCFVDVENDFGEI